MAGAIGNWKACWDSGGWAGRKGGEGLESQEEVGGCALFMMLSISRQQLQDTPTGCQAPSQNKHALQRGFIPTTNQESADMEPSLHSQRIPLDSLA